MLLCSLSSPRAFTYSIEGGGEWSSEENNNGERSILDQHETETLSFLDIFSCRILYEISVCDARN